MSEDPMVPPTREPPREPERPRVAKGPPKSTLEKVLLGIGIAIGSVFGLLLLAGGILFGTCMLG
jgi:hypothetical protein